MVGIGHLAAGGSAHCHRLDLVCVAIDRFRGCDWAGSALFSVAYHHIQSIDGKTVGPLPTTHSDGGG